MRHNHCILTLLCCASMLTAACHRQPAETVQDEELADPTTTYSLTRTEPGSGIEVISETGNDPFKTRQFIESYSIPEVGFNARRAKFLQLLDQLKAAAAEDTVRYDEVDSLNYMAIHYLLDLLQNPKSLAGGIRHPMLRCKVSPDKRLRLYAWDEHIAPGQRSELNLFQYRTDDNRLIAAFKGSGRTHDETDFLTGQIESIHPLFRTGDSVRLYLLSYAGSHGDEHLYKGFGCLRALADSLDFTYPAFEGKRPFAAIHHNEKETAQATFDSRRRTVQLQRIPAAASQRDSLCRSYLFDGQHFNLNKP